MQCNPIGCSASLLYVSRPLRVAAFLNFFIEFNFKRSHDFIDIKIDDNVLATMMLIMMITVMLMTMLIMMLIMITITMLIVVMITTIQPLILKATSCWKLDWDELESNQQHFHSLCHHLNAKVRSPVWVD